MRRVALVLAVSALLAGPLAAQLHVTVAGVGEAAQHRVDAGNGLELSSGTVYGASLTAQLGAKLEFGVLGTTGTLTRDSGGAENASLARGEAHVAVLAMPWLALSAGLDMHTFRTPLAVQRWTSLRVAAEGRLAFAGDNIWAIGRFELYPLVDVTGLDHPNRAFGAASGLGFGAGRIVGDAVYSLERYDFPAVNGVARIEQLSSLRLRVGVALGR